MDREQSSQRDARWLGESEAFKGETQTKPRADRQVAIHQGQGWSRLTVHRAVEEQRGEQPPALPASEHQLSSSRESASLNRVRRSGNTHLFCGNGCQGGTREHRE